MKWLYAVDCFALQFWRWRKFSVWTIFTKDFKVFFCLRTIRFFVTANIDVVQFYQKTLFRDIWFGSFEYLHLFTYFLMIVSELLSLCAMCMWDTVLHRYSTFSECNDSLRFFIWKFSTFESVSFLSAWDFDAYEIPCKNSETDCSTKTIIGHWKLFVSWEKLGFPRRCSTFLWNARKYPKNQWNEVITYPKKKELKQNLSILLISKKRNTQNNRSLPGYMVWIRSNFVSMCGIKRKYFQQRTKININVNSHQNQLHGKTQDPLWLLHKNATAWKSERKWNKLFILRLATTVVAVAFFEAWNIRCLPMAIVFRVPSKQK